MHDGGPGMKLITAYVRPDRVNEVKQALFRAQIFKITITNALGCGEEPAIHENYRGADQEVDLRKRVRVEIALNDAYVHVAIDAIIEGAKTGAIGDGKILVQPLEDVIRIRTGERGATAIG